jgi:hypothetical protein
MGDRLVVGIQKVFSTEARRRRYAEPIESGTPCVAAGNRDLRRSDVRSDDAGQLPGETQRSFLHPDPAPVETPG